MAAVVLGWRPRDFWAATPHEFWAAIEYKREQTEAEAEAARGR
jgi:hypothetical protein